MNIFEDSKLGKKIHVDFYNTIILKKYLTTYNIFFDLCLQYISWTVNKTEKPFSLQDDEKCDKTDKSYQ